MTGRILSIFIVLLSIPLSQVRAQSTNSTYELSLVYDTVTHDVRVDPAARTNYRVAMTSYEPTVSASVADILAIVVGAKERTLGKYGIALPSNAITGQKTAFHPSLPYFPNAVRIDLYRGSKTIARIDVTGSSVCRENERCEIEFGENAKNCPADCADLANVPPPPPRAPSQISVTPATAFPSAGPTADSERDTEEGGSLPLTAVAIGLFVLGSASFVVWLKVRSAKEDM